MRRLSCLHIVVPIILICIGFLILKTCKTVPSLKELFTARSVEIDQTPILISEIKAIGQLMTAAASDEVVIESTSPTRGSGFVNSVNRYSPFKILPSADKRIVLIGRGKVLAGTDMKQLQQNSVRISGDTVWLTLPKAVILDAIINPSDFETFEEEGNWTAAEIIPIKMNARQQMINRAIQKNILVTADKKATAIMEHFLNAAGYKVAIVRTAL